MLDLRTGRGAATTPIAQALDASMPPLGSSVRCVEGDILRLGPEQWLLVAATGGRWSEDMRIPGATLCDVSHGRVAVRVSGPDVRAALGKGCMLDLHPRVFGPGACASTVIAKIQVIVHRLPQAEAAFDLYAARSFAGSFWHWLTEASLEYGYEVAP